MTNLRIAMLGSILLSFVGCKSEGHATQFCLGPDGTSQDCGLGCTIEKNEKACAKWAEKNKELCGKISKEECQEICEKDQNLTACELVKNWKS
jgi:hypothetical protein